MPLISDGGPDGRRPERLQAARHGGRLAHKCDQGTVKIGYCGLILSTR